MKLNEIRFIEPEQHAEPLLISLIRDRIQKGDRVYRRVRKGEGSTPEWLESVARTMKQEKPYWAFRGQVGYKPVNVYGYFEDEIHNVFLIPGTRKGTWQIKRQYDLSEDISD